MDIPGSDLLDMAFDIISPQAIPFYAVTGQTKNALRQTVDQSSKVSDFPGSVQPVPQSKYHYLGLDLKKTYVNVWISVDQSVISRDTTSAFIVWRGRKFEFVGKTDWFVQDGWTKVLAVDVGAHQ